MALPHNERIDLFCVHNQGEVGREFVGDLIVWLQRQWTKVNLNLEDCKSSAWTL